MPTKPINNANMTCDYVQTVNYAVLVLKETVMTHPIWEMFINLESWGRWYHGYYGEEDIG
jgi:hypothetical protein